MRHEITIELTEERSVFLTTDHLSDCSIGKTIDLFDRETAKKMELIVSQEYTLHYGINGVGVYMTTVQEFNDLFGPITTKDPVEIFKAMISIDKIRARVCRDIISEETFKLIVCKSEIAWQDAKDALADVYDKGRKLNEARRRKVATVVVGTLAELGENFFTADVPPY